MRVPAYLILAVLLLVVSVCGDDYVNGDGNGNGMITTPTVEALFETAKAQYKRGRLDLAAELLRDILKIDRNHKQVTRTPLHTERIPLCDCGVIDRPCTGYLTLPVDQTMVKKPVNWSPDSCR